MTDPVLAEDHVDSSMDLRDSAVDTRTHNTSANIIITDFPHDVIKDHRDITLTHVRPKLKSRSEEGRIGYSNETMTSASEVMVMEDMEDLHGYRNTHHPIEFSTADTYSMIDRTRSDATSNSMSTEASSAALRDRQVRNLATKYKLSK
jgi:hypothetical protein